MRQRIPKVFVLRLSVLSSHPETQRPSVLSLLTVELICTRLWMFPSGRFKLDCTASFNIRLYIQDQWRYWLYMYYCVSVWRSQQGGGWWRASCLDENKLTSSGVWLMGDNRTKRGVWFLVVTAHYTDGIDQWQTVSLFWVFRYGTNWKQKIKTLKTKVTFCWTYFVMHINRFHIWCFHLWTWSALIYCVRGVTRCAELFNVVSPVK